MTRREALKRARELLTENRIDDPEWEAELLLRDTLGIDRVKLYTDRDHVLTPRQEAAYWQKIERRIGGEPSAYIVGQREFYGLDFAVSGSVLIPRPETEMLVDRAIGLARKLPSPVMADVGTGSGAIAISIAVNVPAAKLYAMDVSGAALDIARQNARRHRVADRVIFLQGDLLEPLPESADVIVANLPYVRTVDLPAVNTAGHEPRLALDGGADGLDVVRRLCAGAGRKLKPGGTLLLEIGVGQGEAVAGLLCDLFPRATVEVIPDWNKIPRMVVMALPHSG